MIMRNYKLNSGFYIFNSTDWIPLITSWPSTSVEPVWEKSIRLKCWNFLLTETSSSTSVDFWQSRSRWKKRKYYITSSNNRPRLPNLGPCLLILGRVGKSYLESKEAYDLWNKCCRVGLNVRRKEEHIGSVPLWSPGSRSGLSCSGNPTQSGRERTRRRFSPNVRPHNEILTKHHHSDLVLSTNKCDYSLNVK